MRKINQKIITIILIVLLIVIGVNVRPVFGKTESDELKELLDEYKEDLGDLSQFKTIVDETYNDLYNATKVDDTLKDKLLKLDFFSKRGVNVGTKYIDLGEVQNGDKYQFESAFNFDNVDNIKASLISKSEVPDLKLLDFSLDNIKLDKIDPFTAFFAILLVLGL